MQYPWLRFLSIDFVLVAFALGSGIAALTSRRPVTEALGSASLSAGGFLFIAYPLCYLPALHSVGVNGRKLLLLTLVVVWAGDTAAYFVGRALGRHKLAPAISPAKTWEGAVANVLASAGAALAFLPWLEISWGHLVGLGLVVSVAGQAGDLLESAFKRSAAVKDSGNLLPGHGGVLDRIDALILAGPAAWWYLQLFVWPHG